MLGPFSKYADKYYGLNLSIFPCGGENGKLPLVKWKKYQHQKPHISLFKTWLERYDDENIGLITGSVNSITVVDCDDPERTLESLEEEYGETPIIVQTPSGGKHLYYRYNGEGSQNRFREKIDIKADGGYVIAPWSINPKNHKTYDFIKGSLEEVKNLPTSKNTSLPKYNEKNLSSICDISRHNLITEGERNRHLFKITKNFASLEKTYEEILGFARTKNKETLSPPLPNFEVERTVRSVWKYKEEGRLWLPGEQRIDITADVFKRLCGKPKALTLYVFLKMHHNKNRNEFTIIHKCVGEKLSFEPRAVAQSINDLIDENIIQRVHTSNGKKDGHRYRFV